MSLPWPSRRWLPLALVVAGLGSSACDGDETGGGEGGPQPSGPCQPGEEPLESGGCLPAGEGAGIAPELCGEGFAPDGASGCYAILPAAPCPAGQMAVPGEETCRPVAPCGEGTWGDIPVEANTQHVDASYAGAGSDGSAERPWPSVQQAIDAAETGAIVAVAAGSYAEQIDFGEKAVRLWGRCPELVEITAQRGTDIVTVSGAQAEVHTLAITGSGSGLFVTGPHALVDRVWIHDCTRAGMQLRSDATVQGVLIEQTVDIGLFIVGGVSVIQDSVIRASQRRGVSIENDTYDPAQVTLSGLVVEQNHESAVFIQASDVSIERSVMRDTDMGGVGYLSGSGLYAQVLDSIGLVANVTVDKSVFERNRHIAVDIWGANLTMTASVVRDTFPDDLGLAGRGLEIANETDTGQRSTAMVVSSVIERSHDRGVVGAGAHVTLDRSIVRDTMPIEVNTQPGVGVSIQRSLTEAEPSRLTVRRSLIERNRVAGIFSSGADVVVESTLVRDTAEEVATGLLGRALSVTGKTANDPARTNVLVRWSAFERNREVGVFAGGSVDVTLEATRISDTLPQLSRNSCGWGATAQEFSEVGGRASMRVAGCLFERAREHALVALGSDLEVVDTVIRDTTARELDGLGGDGILFAAWDSLAAGSVTGAVLERNARVGVGSFGAVVRLANTSFECNGIDLNGELHEDVEFAFADEGGNHCGCGQQQWECRALSNDIEPPQPIQ